MNNKSQLGSVIDELQGKRKGLESQRAELDKKIVDLISKQSGMSPEDLIKGLTKQKTSKRPISDVANPATRAKRIGNVNKEFYADAVSASKPKLRKGDTVTNIGSKIYATIKQDLEDQKLHSELAKNFEQEKFEQEKRRHDELMAAFAKAKAKPKRKIPERDEKGRFKKVEKPAPAPAPTKPPAPGKPSAPAPAPAKGPTPAPAPKKEPPPPPPPLSLIHI